MTAIAGIVTFHPDPGELRRLARSVSADVSEVVVYCNSPLAEAEEAGLRAEVPNLAIIRPAGNEGLGTAYNAFLARASEVGASHLLLLDQDSLPSAGMIPRLAAVSAALVASGERPAVVGPRPVGPDGVPLKLPRLPGPGRGGALPVSFVISSGSLVSLAEADAVGPFRADFFIDAIDIEWCLRARAAGASIWVAADVTMDHRLGRGVIRLPFGIHLVDQPPKRLYTFVRNQVAMLRMAHVPLRHKAKTVATMPVRMLVHLVRQGFARHTRRAFVRGVRNGWQGRLGPPEP